MYFLPPFVYDFHENDRLLKNEETLTVHAGYLYERRVRDLMANHSKDDPIFMYLALPHPHSPLEAPEEFLPQYSFVEDEKRRNYSALVSQMDAIVGTLITSLEKNQMLDDSIIIVQGDNGANEVPQVYGPGGGSNYPYRSCCGGN